MQEFRIGGIRFEFTPYPAHKQTGKGVNNAATGPAQRPHQRSHQSNTGKRTLLGGQLTFQQIINQNRATGTLTKCIAGTGQILLHTLQQVTEDLVIFLKGAD